MTFAFAGTSRFQLLRKLGEGGMGVVYEAYDQERGIHTALKTIRAWDADTFLRFKEEFRAYQDLDHPNLVQLGELYEDNGAWFFTMELVKGQDILSYFRGRRTDMNRWPSANLQGLFQQLFQAVSSLHSAGKVHRDIKPSNILVSEDGRVVLIDYGLAAELHPDDRTTTRVIAGTPAYMAPEVINGERATPASDWYSVGVLLYQMLTGQLPFIGTPLKMLEEKQRHPPPSPQSRVFDAPKEWSELCVALMNPCPNNRPSSHPLMGNPSLQGRAVPFSPSRVDFENQTPFVGRLFELSKIQEYLHVVEAERRGKSLILVGESGVGKSAIVMRFAFEIRTKNPNILFLEGRCYEHETIPYKAVDRVMDKLSRMLVRFPKWEAMELFSGDTLLLARVFPALCRIEAVAELYVPPHQIDPQELRRRTIKAFRTLFARLSERFLIVMTVDDLQWADADSMLLLDELLRPPEEPALLLLGTARSGTGLESSKLPGEGPEISLGRLGDSESRELLGILLNRSNSPKAVNVDREAILRESKGHPLFIDELVRHHLESSRTTSSPTVVQLDEAIWGRACQLNGCARILLEILSLCPSALRQVTAERIAGLDGVDGFRQIKKLKNSRFVRTTKGTDGHLRIEPYHDRVREAVCSRLDRHVARSHHEQIAIVLEVDDGDDAEALAVHWLGANRSDKAILYLERAAEKANNALAFDRAAKFYDECLGLLPEDDANRRTLHEKRAEALANGGHGEEAGYAYRLACVGADADVALELKRKAAEQFLRSGNMDEGLDDLGQVLAAFGLQMPRTTRQAVLSFLWGSLRLKVRGLGFHTREVSDLPPELVSKIDLCWAATVGLSMVDTIRAIDFHVRHLRLALDAGEPFRIVRGLAMDYGLSVARTGSSRGRSQRSLLIAKRITEETPSLSSLQGTIAASQAFAEYFQGHWQEAYEYGVRAEDVLRHERKGVAWELATARRITCWSLGFLGRTRELSKLVDDFLKESLESGDRYAAIGVRSGLPNMAWLVRDQPQRAREETNEAIHRWSSRGFHIQHLWDLYAQTQVDLYEMNAESAYERVYAKVDALQSSALPRFPWNRILFTDLQARSALGLAAHDPNRRPEFLAAARKATLQLRAERTEWCAAFASMAEGGLLYLQGDVTRAVEKIELARTDFTRLAMKLHAAAAQWCLLRLSAPPNRSELQKGLDAYFAEEQIASPRRMMGVFVPWLPADCQPS